MWLFKKKLRRIKKEVFPLSFKLNKISGSTVSESILILFLFSRKIYHINILAPVLTWQYFKFRIFFFLEIKVICCSTFIYIDLKSICLLTSLKNMNIKIFSNYFLSIQLSQLFQRFGCQMKKFKKCKVKPFQPQIEKFLTLILK